eukprot:gene615-764_t
MPHYLCHVEMFLQWNWRQLNLNSIDSSLPELKSNKIDPNLIYNRNCSHVDIVYTWVNGSDPDHMKSKAQRLNQTDETVKQQLFRYRDNGGLRYSLRSVRKYAPWVKNIWIVTNGQIPSWLNQEQAKKHNINLIFHKDFMDPDDLPTFNSNAIESSFPNLPEQVSNCFIYFNDDIFFGSPVNQTNYFDEDFNPTLSDYAWEIDSAPLEDDDDYTKTLRNSNRVLDQLWNETKSRRASDHGVYAFDRKILMKMKEDIGEQLKNTTAAPIRSPKNIVFVHLYLHFATRFGHPNILPSGNYYGGISTGGLETSEKVFADIYKVYGTNTYKTICINDGFDDNEMMYYLQKELHKLYEYYFPDIPPWEYI